MYSIKVFEREGTKLYEHLDFDEMVTIIEDAKQRKVEYTVID